MQPDEITDAKERILQRVRKRAYQAYARSGGRTLEAAVKICRRCLGPDGAPSAAEPPRTIKELQASQQTALRKWAQASGLILDGQAFERRWKEQGCPGETENDIYYDPTTGRWFKRTICPIT